MTDIFDRLKTALADRYAIERELGAGGMATVYLAQDLKLHRQVALKVLRPELAALRHDPFERRAPRLLDPRRGRGPKVTATCHLGGAISLN